MDSVHLTFETTLGDFDADFAPSETLREVKRRVLAGIMVAADQADQFTINLDEQPLDETKTVAEFGLQPEAWLVVERRQKVLS